ncbi:response regulator [Caldimonas brevitalea]|uniref:Chemotaxis protein methyltransferase CheR n=1 Tax=Caldimonas brevitalea TaxID=413882 RepID=A0A0G3BEF7_9BURK|nr:response regulator [Caldimonas brevitalea]AKJ27712.1 chemotaxis protein methyltransferase CheR [Caldimonas brevitalea]
MRILVVDDCEEGAAMLATLLGLFAHQVETAGDAEAALRVAADFDPDCVVLDLALPGLSGLDLARQLRTEGAPGRPVLIALSGWSSPEDVAASAAAGCHHHLAKPLDFELLCELLRRADPLGADAPAARPIAAVAQGGAPPSAPRRAFRAPPARH